MTLSRSTFETGSERHVLIHPCAVRNRCCHAPFGIRAACQGSASPIHSRKQPAREGFAAACAGFRLNAVGGGLGGVRLSPDFLPEHARQIGEGISAWVAKTLAGSPTSFSGPAPELPPLRVLPHEPLPHEP